jgi:hypothetical protein
MQQSNYSQQQQQDSQETESPDISLTFVHVWSEPQTISRQNGCKVATKAFLTKDTVGDMHLCYLQEKSEQLAVVK